MRVAGPAVWALTFLSAVCPVVGGQDLTVRELTDNAFSHPIPGLDRQQRRDFFVGNSFFKQNWVIAPASTAARDGLGPLFNARSCSACHFKDGRGAPPEEGGGFTSLLLRLSVPGEPEPTLGVRPVPIYGDQLQNMAIPGVEPEGTPGVSFELVEGTFADGSGYTLRRPVYRIDSPKYGPLPADLQISPRLAPQIIGMGLLEAIREEDLLALADPEDDTGDGISGRPNWVYDQMSGARQLGRFGWKANVATVRQQVAGAFHGDMGITSGIFPRENDNEGHRLSADLPSGGEPEISDALLEKVVLYSQTLAVPARRNMEDSVVRHGEAIFERIGCASCHHPEFITGPHAIPQLANQRIRPYTDLLLHDMGEDLADGRPDFEANGREWRTPPLWGIGMIPTVNGHSHYLHDGRARNLEEAILWHGGEAEKSKQSYLELPRSDREALLRFLESL